MSSLQHKITRVALTRLPLREITRKRTGDSTGVRGGRHGGAVPRRSSRIPRGYGAREELGECGQGRRGRAGGGIVREGVAERLTKDRRVRGRGVDTVVPTGVVTEVDLSLDIGGDRGPRPVPAINAFYFGPKG